MEATFPTSLCAGDSSTLSVEAGAATLPGKDVGAACPLSGADDGDSLLVSVRAGGDVPLGEEEVEVSGGTSSGVAGPGPGWIDCPVACGSGAPTFSVGTAAGGLDPPAGVPLGGTDGLTSSTTGVESAFFSTIEVSSSALLPVNFSK